MIDLLKCKNITEALSSSNTQEFKDLMEIFKNEVENAESFGLTISQMTKKYPHISYEVWHAVGGYCNSKKLISHEWCLEKEDFRSKYFAIKFKTQETTIKIKD